MGEENGAVTAPPMQTHRMTILPPPGTPMAAHTSVCRTRPGSAVQVHALQQYGTVPYRPRCEQRPPARRPLTCAYISRMRCTAAGPEPSVMSMQRSTPSCRTAVTRRVRQCLRSLSVKLEGSSEPFSRSTCGGTRAPGGAGGVGGVGGGGGTGGPCWVCACVQGACACACVCTSCACAGARERASWHACRQTPFHRPRRCRTQRFRLNNDMPDGWVCGYVAGGRGGARGPSRG